MCGRGSNKAQRELQEQQNQQSQANFTQSHALAEQQFLEAKEAQERAEQREQERQDRITASSNKINDAFNNRDHIYGSLEDATFELNKEALDKNRTDGARSLKHSLSRAGLTGGSVDVDKNADVLDRYNTGLRSARTAATGAGNDARSRDQQLKNSLLTTASSGSFNGQELLDSSSGALSAIENSPPQVVPDFSAGKGAYFNDLINGLGSAAGAYANSGAKDGYSGNKKSNTFTYNNTGGANGNIRSID